MSENIPIEKDPDAVTEQEALATNIGVVNPYALAEVRTGRRIPRDPDPDTREVVVKALKTDYESLFDPAKNMLLYAGMKYDKKTGLLDRSVVEEAESDETPTPEGVEAAVIWSDLGDFITDYVEYSDPIQGAVGDCYLIAALSSVAWARTYVIAHHCRRGPGGRGPIDMIRYNHNGDWLLVEVDEAVPTIGGSPLYARSEDRGEIWPAMYEKAYAKWKTNHTGQRPNILAIAGGDMVRATQEIMGGHRYYYATQQLSADRLWSKVRANSISRKTFNPMTAWTYPSGQASPDNVNYSSANIVANHAYSVLGWDYRNGEKYIILRNPWGTKEATVGVTGGNWVAWDAPYYGGPGQWISINLPRNDGVFALAAETFKKYYAGLGVVK